MSQRITEVRDVFDTALDFLDKMRRFGRVNLETLQRAFSRYETRLREGQLEVIGRHGNYFFSKSNDPNCVRLGHYEWGMYVLAENWFDDEREYVARLKPRVMFR